MGSLRRGLNRSKRLHAAGLFLVLTTPTRAWAEVCDKVRPNWTPGTPATLVDEALHWLSTPPALVLIIATALALRFRSSRGGVFVVVCWTGLVALATFFRDESVYPFAIQEGCIASPALFIGLVAAICVGTILYTAPNTARSDPRS